MILIALFCLLIISNFALAEVDQFSTLFSSNITVGTSCQDALQKLSLLETSEPQLMAEYWDSWGKPNHGILKGHTAFLGYYDECMNLKKTAIGDTRFCLYAVKMNIGILHNYQDEVCLTDDCSNGRNLTSSVNIKIGVCYPEACSPNEFGIVLSKMDITSINTITSNPFSNKTSTVNVRLTDVDNSATFCPQTDVEYDTVTIVIIVMCGVLIGLVVVGTVADIMSWLCLSEKDGNVEIVQVSSEDNKKDTEHPPSLQKDAELQQLSPLKSFLLAFSLYNTVPILLSTKQSPSAVKAIGGIRMFCNFSIVAIHVISFFPTFQPSLIQSTPQSSSSALILLPVFHGSLTVDAFFLLSATLSTYLTLKDIKRHGKFRFAYFYLNRYFRLSILYYFYTLFAVKLFVHLGDGPVWYQPDYYACQKNWWYNILYLAHSTKSDELCNGVAWHLSVDMMLYIISPILILLLYHVPRIGLISVTLTVTGATAYVGIIAASYGFKAVIIFYPNFDEQFSKLYSHPLFRVNPYFVGIILGYILYKNQNKKQRSVFYGKCFRTMKWCMAICLYCTAVYGIFGELSGAYHFSDVENMLYLMFSGLGLSIGISIIIYICNTGHGGVVNRILSWPGWEPPVKLSYSVYLVHPMIMSLVLGTLQSSLVMTGTLMLVLLAATLIISYGVSAVVVLFVEFPLTNVVSMCFRLAGMEARDK
ncbi:nose resistant to fluoxetine protein 6-like [Dysidea avara]|uniref:nose resistant to fluoxetine protein 6-like n=1 Tax=Dysidea avara TaxID=196820 RepID=UPI003316BD31